MFIVNMLVLFLNIIRLGYETQYTSLPMMVLAKKVKKLNIVNETNIKEVYLQAYTTHESTNCL